MSGRRTKEPDDPLLTEIGKLAEKYGDTELLRVCFTVIQKYADLGARQALGKRKGDKSIECAVCRERAAMARQLEDTLKRVRTSRPIGGGAPSQNQEEG